MVKRAHGVCDGDAADVSSGGGGVNDQENAQPRWIVSVAARANSKIIASGSSDGKLRIWRVSETYKSLAQIGEFEIVGFLFWLIKLQNALVDLNFSRMQSQL